MTLTANQIANTTADQFTVRHRYFAANALLNTLTLADYQVGPGPIGWTVSGDTITPATGWTEITRLIAWEGEFIDQWRDAQRTWSVNLSGQDFSASYFGLGNAIACFVRYTRGVYDTGWTLEWLGAVDRCERRDDYRAGDLWRMTVGSLNVTLEVHDAPRLVAGKINLATGAGLDTSPTLTSATDEASSGEFVNTTVTIADTNMIDGSMATLWISQNVPTIEGEGAAAAHRINEVFFKPVAGYDASKVWWIEIYNNSGSSTGDNVTFDILAYTSAGKIAHVVIPKGDEQEDGTAIIICANRARAEAYAGSFEYAARVYETDMMETDELVSVGTNESGLAYLVTSGEHCDFDLNTTGGWVFWLYKGGWLGGGDWHDAVKWGTAVAGPGGDDHSMWTGATIDISGLVGGQSLRRSPACTDTNTAADWVAGIPTPGHYFSASNAQWVKLELLEHTSTLTDAITSESTTIKFDEGVQGWPASGQGICETDVFDYTNRTGDTLIGVTNISGNHAKGATCHPYVDGLAQTGWFATDVVLRRRPGMPKIKRVRAWFSKYAGNPDYTEENFWESYEEPFPTVVNGTSDVDGTISEDGAQTDLTIRIPGPDDGDGEAVIGRWVRTILLAIDAMWDGGRCKINEIEVSANESLVDFVYSVSFGRTAAQVATYLLDTYTWLAYADIKDNTGTDWGLISTISTAVSPIPTVIEDLASSHGCVISYTPTGQVAIERNPWWPSAVRGVYGLYIIGTDDVRGEIRFRLQRNPITGVAVIAHNTAGEPLPRHTYPAGATGSSVRELTNVVVPDEATAKRLAYYTYLRLANDWTAELTLRGIGEWCQPLQRVRIDWRGVNYGQWIIERVMRRWRWQNGQRLFETILELRSYLSTTKTQEGILPEDPSL